MDTSSSSKVTVEYHDPSGVFPLISKDLAARLPLRNLYWQTPTRPLRQIKSLHVEFVPDTFTNNSLQPPAQRTDNEAATSFDIVRSGVDPRKGVKERRHQIPGLKTSPYLKLYILRADDKETYKTIERKKIREWIRDNAAANAKGKGENHDAFEWLIVHVVIPDTIASSEPRWRESSAKDSDELKERKKQGMKLPGKSTRTTFDKLRADFNESGKSGQDRVAQIRLTRAQVSADLLPTPAMATTIEETNEEREKAWNDLMTKMKTLVLGPFDTRVRQYETDVTEQESRRSLPGFNFCTFFIHKEGLAKALESIGLVEDALVIYDELSLGFETVLAEIARGQAGGTATTFAPYTDDIVDRITGSRGMTANGASAKNAESRNDTDNAGRLDKDYRERIVRSDISVFDFSSYIFSRQNALILRLANANAARAGLGSTAKEGNEDLVLISEVCWRAANFIHNNARALRLDLATHRAAQWEKKVESPISETDIDSLVCSWTYITAGQMLDETFSSTLDQVSDPSKREGIQNGIVTGLKQAEAGLGGVNVLPQRTTSLPARKSRVTELQGRDSIQSASESDLMSPPSSSDIDRGMSSESAPGLIELVTYRAELLMMQRKMLEQLAKQREWLAGWALMGETVPGKMEDVSLDDNSSESLKPNASNLLAPTLKTALSSKETFHETYDRLSDKAMRLYIAATQSKRAEAIMGDLAILKYQQSDFGYAASYFQHVLPFYAEEGWSLMEVEALRMHAMCLKQLDRREEHVTTLLALVAKACGWRRDQRLSSLRTPTFDEMAHVEGVLPDVVGFSRNLDADVTNPAEAFFSDVELGQEVIHRHDRDGFALRLRLRHLLDDPLRLDRVTARLVHVDDPNSEIWLYSSATTLERGLNEIELESSTVAFGRFLVDGIFLQANKVLFVHEPQPKKQDTEPSIADLEKPEPIPEAHKQHSVIVYPAQQAFSAEIALSKHIEIDKPRHLEVRLSSGWNEITQLDLKLKPGSAGLRLHLADSSFNNIDVRDKQDAKPGQLSLAGLAKGESAVIGVPYTLEQAGQEILVRLDASYTTAKGTFAFPTSARLATQLPLDVDVNDVFHLDALFSKFTVRTTRQTPLSISEATLKSSTVYDVDTAPALAMPMAVYEKQPVNLVYKITRKASAAIPTNKKAAALALSLQYHLVDELIFAGLRDRFATALAESSFASLSRLLLPFLHQHGKMIFSSTDLEMAVLLMEARVPSFEEIGWSEILVTLPPAIRQQLMEWLKTWHENNQQVAIEQGSAEFQRTITISVDVPNVDFVHRASLSLLTQQEQALSELHCLPLGQPVKTQLRIASTKNWSTFSERSDIDETTQNFIYDIQADSDAWLVGGQRRGHFKAASSEGKELTFDLTLVPLKLGPQPLPNVEVQAEQQTRRGEQDEHPLPSCETHYESAGRVVRVIRGAKVSRVYIPESPSSSSSSSARPLSRPGAASPTKEAG